MLKKTCPWCGEKPTFNQLGFRPVLAKPKWYQFSRTVRVCPYCAGAVKLGGNSTWFMLLALPSLVSFLIYVFTGYDALDELGATNIGWALLFAGCLGTYLFGVFQKEEGV